jgi:hypothetical protein
MWSLATCHEHSHIRMTAEVSVELRHVPYLILCVTQLKLLLLINTVSRDSAVGIATGYGLDD